MQALTEERPLVLTSNTNQAGFARSKVSIQQAVFTSVAPETLAKAAGLDPVRFDADNLGKAEDRCRLELEFIEREHGPASADTAIVLLSLGEILRRRRKYAEAE